MIDLPGLQKTQTSFDPYADKAMNISIEEKTSHKIGFTANTKAQDEHVRTAFCRTRTFLSLTLGCEARGNSKETLTSAFKKSTERKQTIKKFEIFYKEKYASWKKILPADGKKKIDWPERLQPSKFEKKLTCCENASKLQLQIAPEKITCEFQTA